MTIPFPAFNPLPDNKFLESSKLKEFADDNFKFDENGRKLSKQIENTPGKGEIARYKQFLLFPQCFHKAGSPEVSKGVIVWEWVKQIYFTLIGKEVLIYGTNLSQFCFLRSTLELASNGLVDSEHSDCKTNILSQNN